MGRSMVPVAPPRWPLSGDPSAGPRDRREKRNRQPGSGAAFRDGRLTGCCVNPDGAATASASPRREGVEAGANPGKCSSRVQTRYAPVVCVAIGTNEETTVVRVIRELRLRHHRDLFGNLVEQVRRGNPGVAIADQRAAHRSVRQTKEHTVDHAATLGAAEDRWIFSDDERGAHSQPSIGTRLRAVP